MPSQDNVLVKFKIEGNGKIIGVGNGNPRDMSSFQRPEKKVFQGKGLLIVQPSGKVGKIKIRAEASGFKSNDIEIKTF